MTFQMIIALLILAAVMFLFITKWLRVDIVAILVMISLLWFGLINPSEAFSGFSSNAVITIIAVMIMGYGMDRSGVINMLIRPVVSIAKSHEIYLICLISLITGLVSAFMPNVAAAAFMMPALLRITKTMEIPASRLLMPMGFAAILGGNLTMIGSSPLLILNDLLSHIGEKQYSLFSITPIGIALLGAGILYFVIFGKHVLPGVKSADREINTQQRLIKSWKLPTSMHQCAIPPKSPLIAKTRSIVKMRSNYRLNLLAIAEGKDIYYAPWRHTPFAEGQSLAILGSKEDFDKFVSDYKLVIKKSKKLFTRLFVSGQAGFAELIIPVKSSVAGKTLRTIEIRKSYGVEPIVLLSGNKEERGAFSDQTLQPGNTLIVHGLWERIKAMADSINFVLVTPVESAENPYGSKPLLAVLCFAGSLALAFCHFPVSLCFLSGAVAMIILRIIPIDEAYRAVDWKTVFLLAGLIPLGIAMDKTGTAGYIAAHVTDMIQGSSPVIILFSIAILSTIFSLFMSNVSATVLLVPFVMIIGRYSGLNPRGLALLVALCASNGFLLPVHQVNALISSPGGYTNTDFFKAGGFMTVLYITISVMFIYAFYL